MAVVTARVNLNAASFPMLAKTQGQSIIIRETDTNYVPSVSSKEDADRDVGIPQVYYCHNVLPTPEGLSAVGYEIAHAPAGSVSLEFQQVVVLRDAAGNSALLATTATGRLFILHTGVWQEFVGLPSVQGRMITTAYVSGITYVFFERIGCFVYDFALEELAEVYLQGIDTFAVNGVVGSNGYLIVWTDTEVAWSSTITPTDFVPSLTTGAGGGGVEGAKGKIVACAQTLGGFVVYTTVNAVVAGYSGNARYPYNFREIVGAGGLQGIEQVSVDGNSGGQYAYTTAGLQLVSTQQAQVILPAVTDFLSGGLMEDFVAGAFVYTQLTAPMKRKLVVIANRYLVLSYGITSYTHALVYDIALKRMGKLRITHTDCFDYAYYKQQGYEVAKRSLAFLQADGTVRLADTDFLTTSGEGVLITGKYQLRRSRLLQLNEVTLENTGEGAMTLKNLPALDGKNTASSTGYLLSSSGGQRKYLFHDVATNHSLLFEGSFSLSSLVLRMNTHGRM